MTRQQGSVQVMHQYYRLQRKESHEESMRLQRSRNIDECNVLLVVKATRKIVLTCPSMIGIPTYCRNCFNWSNFGKRQHPPMVPHLGEVIYVSSLHKGSERLLKGSEKLRRGLRRVVWFCAVFAQNFALFCGSFAPLLRVFCTGFCFAGLFAPFLRVFALFVVSAYNHDKT